MDQVVWSELWENFGRRLRLLREERGLTRTQLAELSGVGYNAIHRWEKEQRMPRIDNAAAVAIALGISLNELAGLPS